MHLSFLNLNASVKSYQEYVLDEKSNSFILKMRRCFRKDGQVESTYDYLLNKIWTEKQYIYDELGNDIEEFLLEYGIEIEKWIHIYNDKSQRIESRFYENRELDEYYCYRFNEKGQGVEDLQYNAEGELIAKTLYQFDNNGNAIEETNYDENGELSEKKINTYNEQNVLVHSEIIYHNSEMDSKHISQHIFEHGKAIKVEHCTYNLIDEPNFEIIEYLDNYGNSVKRHFNSHNASEPIKKTVYQYEYDDLGNWIKKQSYENGILIKSLIREYEIF